MAYDFYLSYSGRKCYQTCPKQYWFRYIIKDPSRSDARTSMFGTSIGKIFEWFYEDRLWAAADPEKELTSRIDKAIKYTFDHEKYERGFDIAFESTLRDDLHKFVPKGIEIIRENQFLTPHSKAEVNLDVLYSPPGSDIVVKLAGRADFIHSKDLKDVWLLDGKASKHREKYVDSEQLIWYAVQHYLKYHVAPVRIGFIFWCFPNNPVTWIAYDSDAMRASIKNTMEIVNNIKTKQFDAKPSGNCYRCPYRPKCDEGNRHLAERKAAPGAIDDSVFDLESVH